MRNPVKVIHNHAFYVCPEAAPQPRAIGQGGMSPLYITS
jgi:hypothetical protein